MREGLEEPHTICYNKYREKNDAACLRQGTTYLLENHCLLVTLHALFIASRFILVYLSSLKNRHEEANVDALRAIRWRSSLTAQRKEFSQNKGYFHNPGVFSS